MVTKIDKNDKDYQKNITKNDKKKSSKNKTENDKKWHDNSNDMIIPITWFDTIDKMVTFIEKTRESCQQEQQLFDF